MSFGCWINPETRQVNDDQLVCKAFEALRCEFGKRIDFEAFVAANIKRAYLVLEIEGRNTQTVVKSLRPFAEGMCAKPAVERERRKQVADQYCKTHPHMARMIEKGVL